MADSCKNFISFFRRSAKNSLNSWHMPPFRIELFGLACQLRFGKDCLSGCLLEFGDSMATGHRLIELSCEFQGLLIQRAVPCNMGIRGLNPAQDNP